MSYLTCGDDVTPVENDGSYDGASTYFGVTCVVTNVRDHKLNRQVELAVETTELTPSLFKGAFVTELNVVLDGRAAGPGPYGKRHSRCYVDDNGAVTSWYKVNVGIAKRNDAANVLPVAADILWPFADTFENGSEDGIIIGKPASFARLMVNDIPDCSVAELKVLDGAQVPPCDCKCPAL